jgi:hypothetical protein
MEFVYSRVKRRKGVRRRTLADLGRVVRASTRKLGCRMEGRGGLEVKELESWIFDRKDLYFVSGGGCFEPGKFPTVCSKSRIISYTVPTYQSITAV